MGLTETWKEPQAWNQAGEVQVLDKCPGLVTRPFESASSSTKGLIMSSLPTSWGCWESYGLENTLRVE